MSTLPCSGDSAERRSDIPESINAFWENQSFHNYADYATSDEFRSGLARLRALGHATVCVTMCAEVVWWRCHRRIIADYLMAAGETVFHILGPNHVAPARLTAGAVLEAGGGLFYPGHATPGAKAVHQTDN